MTKEEAIKRIKAWNLDSDDMEVLSAVIPELAESEEEDTRKELIRFLLYRACHSLNEETGRKFIAYLEKQKEQKPAEWSEEDLQHKSWILECLADGKRKMPEYAEDFQAAYNWLKFLRPQPHWRPSEYTLSLVKKVADGEMLTGVEQMAMGTLYEKLKKL